MSRTIDERVVQMRFDNQKFEDNVQTSLSTLEKLKKALKLDDAAKGLEEVEQASRKVKLNGLSSAVETVSLKFSALDVAAARVFQRLTDAAIDTGRKMVDALAFKAAKDGFAEYELKMGSVQTIMASTGESLETVNGYLEELNKYSDQTIYSFSDMTNNIGKFTNAGVKLDKAVLAIKGVSNVAAVSGATTAEASRAMYNFSQALSAGYVKLIDWKSIENANMATQEFKQQLLDTAIELGTVVKHGDQYATVTKNASGKTYEAFDATRNFNESLAFQWMTTDVLTSTLAKYADETTEIGKKAYASAQDIKTFNMLIETLQEALGSGWAQTWELLIGDFNEAKALFTDMGNELSALIEASSEARNNVLYEGMASGWKKWLKEGIDDGETYKTALMDTAREQGIAIDEMVEQAGSLENTFQNGWITNDLLAASVDKLVAKYDGLSKEEKEEMGVTQEQIDHAKELQQKLKDGTIDVAEYAKAFGELSGRENLIAAMKNAFHSLMDIVRPVKEAFAEVFPPLTGERLKDITVRIRELTERFQVSEETAGKIKAVFKGVFSVFQAGITIVGKIANGFKRLFTALKPIASGLLSALAKLGEQVFQLLSGFTGLADGESLLNKVLTGIGEKAAKVGEALKNIDFGALFSGLSAGKAQGLLGTLASIWDRIKSFGTQVISMAKQIGTALLNNLGNGNLLEGLFDVLKTFSIGKLASLVKKLLDGVSNPLDGISGLLDGAKGILDGVKDALKAWQEQLKSKTLMNLAKAVALLAASLFLLSTIDQDQLAGALAAMGGLMGELVGTMALLNKINYTKSGGKAVRMMVGLAAAALILAVAMKKVATLRWEEIGKGLTAIAGLSTILVGSAAILSKNSGTIAKGAGNLILLALSIQLLGKACAALGSLTWEALLKGLIGVGVLMTELSLFTGKTDLSKGLNKASIGLLATAISLKILAGVCRTFGDMSFEGMLQGLTGIGLLLTELALFSSTNMQNSKMLVFSSSMILLGISMKLFASAMSSLANLGWSGIAKSLSAMGGVLAEIILSMKLMEGTIGGVAALLLATVALAALVPVLVILGKMSWESIAKGLVALGGSLAVIGVAGVLLKPLTGTLLKLAGTMMIFAAAVALTGAGMTTIGVGLVAIGAGIGSILAVIGGSVEGIVGGIVALVKGLAGILPEILRGLKDTLAEVCNLIIEGAPAIGKALVALISSALDSLVEIVPKIVSSALQMLREFLSQFQGYVPEIADQLFTILVQIMNVLAERLPELLTAGKNVFSRLLDGIMSMLADMGPEKMKTGLKLLGILVGVLAGTMLILSKIKTDVKSIALLAVLAGAIYVFGDAMAKVSDMPWSSMVGFGAAFAAVLLALAGAIAILGKLDPAAVVIGEAAIAGLGVIAIGLASLAGSAMAGISTSLFSAINTLKLLSDSAGGISQDNVDNAITAVGKLTDMTTTMVFGFNGDVLTWSTNVGTLGEKLSYFHTQTKDLTADSIQGVVDFSGKLKDVYDNLTSLKNIENYQSISDALVDISANLGLYSLNLQGVDVSDEGTQKAVAAMGVLDQIAQATPTTEALAALAQFSDEGDGLSGFATGLYSLTSALAKYAKEAEKVQSIEKIGTFNQIVLELGTLKTNLEKNGILDFLRNLLPGKKENGLSDLSEGINAFVNPLTDFVTLAEGVGDIEKLGVFVQIIDQLAGIKSKMEEDATLWGWLSDMSGHDTLTVFGTGLSAFGEAFKNFVGNMDNLTFDSQTLLDAVDIIGQLALAEATVGNAMTATDGYGLRNLISGNGATTNGLVGLIGTLVTTQTEAAKLDSTIWNNAAGILTGIGNFTVENVSPMDDGTAQALADAFGAMISLAAAELTNETHQNEFSAAGSTLVTELMAGFGSQLERLKTTAGNLATATANAMSERYHSFHTAGFNAVMGFANAIAEYTWYAERQAANMAQLAANAAMRTLDEHSPSRVTYGIGRYFSEGFANGISAYASGAAHAADGMAAGAVTGVNDAIGRISAMLESDMDTTPVIRPVVDLTGAASGAAALNSLFVMNPSLNGFGGSIALRNVGELRLDDGRMPGGSDNQNVVDAITRLESRFNHLSEAVSHMQIVLDSGTLVGETRAQMDQQLGFTAAMRERGN